MSNDDDGPGPSRRMVLKSAGVGASSLGLMNTASADHGQDDGSYDSNDHYEKGFECGYASPTGGEGFVFPEHHDICAADHPETKRLKAACEYTLDNLYPDVTTLVARGAIPYFDILSVGGFSHWLMPGHINDNTFSLDPGRPETVLVNNDNYCSQGVMFIPPQEEAGRESPIYTTGNPDQYENEYIYPKRDDGDVTTEYTYGDGEYGNSKDGAGDGQGYWDKYEEKNFDVAAYEDESTICAPWHRHTDAFARFAWWYNRQFHQGALLEHQEYEFWCVVPAMFHVWPGAPEESMKVYKHDSATESRTGKTACRGGYPNPYTPDDGSELTLEDLPEDLQERAMPADLERELRILGDFDDVTLFQMNIGEILTLVS